MKPRGNLAWSCWGTQLFPSNNNWVPFIPFYIVAAQMNFVSCYYLKRFQCHRPTQSPISSSLVTASFLSQKLNFHSESETEKANLLLYNAGETYWIRMSCHNSRNMNSHFRHKWKRQKDGGFDLFLLGTRANCCDLLVSGSQSAFLTRYKFGT